MATKLFNMLTLNDEELAMLYRIVCSGMLGGSPTTRSALYAKVQVAHEKMRTGTAKKIELEADTNGTEAADGRRKRASGNTVPSAPLRDDAGERDRAARNTKRSRRGKAGAAMDQQPV